MSTSIGAVWVLPAGAAADREAVEAALGRWLDGADRRADRWDLAGVADASLFTGTDEVGFDLLVVRFSSTEYVRAPEKIRAWIEGGFTAARGLGAIFGMLTRYPDHLEQPWLREHVLIPVLMEEWDALRAQPFEAVWLPDA